MRPLVRYLEEAAGQAGDDVVVVLLPEYVPRHRWERFLYNENGRRIRERAAGHAGTCSSRMSPIGATAGAEAGQPPRTIRRASRVTRRNS